MRVLLDVATEIVLQLHLQTIPHFTTLQKAAARISKGILHIAIGRFIQIVSPGLIFAGIDATGFENRHAIPYYSHRYNLRHAFTKCSASSDMKTQLVCAVVIQHHPVSHDTKYFPKLFSQMLDVVAMNIMVLDKRYDSESIHKTIREKNVISMIPVRNRDCLISKTKRRYRKLMRRKFDETLYHKRNKTETIFSVIKRRFDSEIKSYDDTMITKELLYRVLAYNCHRMCLISLVWMMISRKPIYLKTQKHGNTNPYIYSCSK